MKLKNPSNSTSQTLTATTSSQDARLLVRETLRISANLASTPPIANSPPALPLPPPPVERDRFRGDVASFGLVEDQFVNYSLKLICREEVDGRRWEYFADVGDSKQFKKSSIRAVSLHSRQSPVDVSFSSYQRCLFFFFLFFFFGLNIII